MNKTYTNKILDIPYYSQYRDISDTLNAHRACGLTCVKMVLDYYKKDSEQLGDLVSKYIIDEDAYGQSGWKHDFFVDFLKSNNLNAHRKEQIDISLGIEEIKKSVLQGNPVIVSVEQKLFDKKMFHMILITGVRTEESGKLDGFYYNDPGRLTVTNGKNQYVSIKDFVEYWRKMAIFCA